ncbi:MAG: hypothetical protein QOD27_1139 [Microbacteriaceae bacterium]|jgi:hypothetical protein|nr:hypothetical protein [Microbacteriaceae bacterium]MCU1507531.1 hypothetical protein [Microbacteriaceae bacterium]MCU1582522.1 hypothetical protein [Microbacteriaceae bacterium]MDQ1527932.1 hypothetical protein [Microbacteriaceae bacterium]MDQ1549481.1 hypothetical protein [Microbacteriaceae bacterium]
MGRGRQKAKHTKVARELKYFSPDTNYNALERELTHTVPGSPVVNERLEEDLEKWPEFNAPADYSADYSDDEYEAGRGQNKTA